MVSTAENTVGYNDDEQEPDEQQTLMDRVKSDPALMQKIKGAAEELTRLKGERQAINEQMKAIREDIVAEGINRHAFAAAIARWELEATDREERELSYQACCAALGVEHQLDMFKDVVAHAQRPAEPDMLSGTEQKPVGMADLRGVENSVN